MRFSAPDLWLMLACIIVLGLASPTASGATGQGHPSCRSGLTLFHRDALRVETDEHTESDGLSAPIFYECSSRAGRPHILFVGSEGADTSADQFRRFGARLGFHIHIEGGTVEDDYLGWINTKTNIVRYRHVFLLFETTYAIAEDGSIAAVTGDGNQQEVFLIPYNPPSHDRRSLGQKKSLFQTITGGVNPNFIQVTSTTVTWKTSQGALTSVAR